MPIYGEFGNLVTISFIKCLFRFISLLSLLMLLSHNPDYDGPYEFCLWWCVHSLCAELISICFGCWLTQQYKCHSKASIASMRHFHFQMKWFDNHILYWSNTIFIRFHSSVLFGQKSIERTIEEDRLDKEREREVERWKLFSEIGNSFQYCCQSKSIQKHSQSHSSLVFIFIIYIMF